MKNDWLNLLTALYLVLFTLTGRTAYAVLLMIVMLLSLGSCGKPSESCKTQEEMVLRCQAEQIHNNPAGDRAMIRDMCLRDYSVNRCY